MGRGARCGMISPITKNESLRRIPFMLPFQRTKSSNNSEITPLPKWNFIRESQRRRRFKGVRCPLPPHPRLFLLSAPVASSSSSFSSSSSSSSSNFLFVSFRGEGKPRLGIRHQGVYRKDFVTGRYYSAFSNVRGLPLARTTLWERLSRYSLFPSISFRHPPPPSRFTFKWQARNQCNQGREKEGGGDP